MTKEKEKYTKTEIEDESVVPMQTKNRRLFKIRGICEPCANTGGTQKAQKIMISALAKSLIHNRRGPKESNDGWPKSRALSQ